MKFALWILFIALLIAYASCGTIPQEEYLPPVEEDEQVAVEQPLEESAALAEDGYRYKTIRKLRHRRDVSELFAQGTLADDGYHYHAPKPVAQEYLPPIESAESKEALQVSNEYLPPAEAEKEAEKLEITEAPEIVREYLPPTKAPVTIDVPTFAIGEELPSPSNDDSVIIEGPEESAVLADDGYHYRRIRYRRDVSEIVPPVESLYKAPDATEEVKSTYLPPVEEVKEESKVEEEVAKEYLPPVAEIKETPETAELADDGYRYKTIRKLKYRQRRDVSEIASPTPVEEEPISEASIEYLPPAAEVKEASDIPSETAELADDGYRYKTIRKLKYRQRRDVSEIVAPKSAILADDGYHYRIPESSEIIPKVSKEYLPPSEQLQEISEAPVVTESTTAIPVVTEVPTTTPVPVISKEYLPPVDELPLVKAATEVSSTTAAPVVANQYLPPTEEIAQIKEAPEASEETAVLADDGYHYKVGKRFRLRRDVSEIIDTENQVNAESNDPKNEYLPPANLKEASEVTEASKVSSEYLPPAEESESYGEIIEAPEEDSAVLADDGYRYKTVRRLKYRSRRDVSEIVDASPSSEGYSYSTPETEEETILADDGYRYKTIRRLKYRHRRDVSELVAPVEDSAFLSKDGYQYKAPSTAVPKASMEYLPPVENNQEVKEEVLINEPTNVSEALDILELPETPAVSNEYLPPQEITPKEAPAQVVSNEYLPPNEKAQASVEQPQESAVLADDGYHYKTVRRIRYRQRRDVSEIANAPADGYNYNAPIEIEPQEIQYIPPQAEEVAEVKEAADSANLAEDGYRYKTVKRIRYRHRV